MTPTAHARWGLHGKGAGFKFHEVYHTARILEAEHRLYPLVIDNPDPVEVIFVALFGHATSLGLATGAPALMQGCRVHDTSTKTDANPHELQ